MLNILREDKGSVAVLVALVITCLMGFAALVVDMGLLFQTRSQLATMADSAALAGAQSLPSASQAIATANSYASVNGMAGDRVNAIVENANSKITVTTGRTVNLLFAKVLGFTTQDVTATAAASMSGVAGASGVVPLGIVKDEFVYGQTVILKQGGGQGYKGNYSPLGLGGTGGNIYEDNIIYGYSGIIRAGDWVSTETGNMVGPTQQAIETRVGQDPYANFDIVQKGSSRLVIVPMINSLQVNGHNEVLVVGFAGFFLEGANGGVVTGRFKQMVANGGIAGQAQDFGLSTIKLTQ
jgi:hypothetical protein